MLLPRSIVHELIKICFESYDPPNLAQAEKWVDENVANGKVATYYYLYEGTSYQIESTDGELLRFKEQS